MISYLVLILIGVVFITGCTTKTNYIPINIPCENTDNCTCTADRSTVYDIISTYIGNFSATNISAEHYFYNNGTELTSGTGNTNLTEYDKINDRFSNDSFINASLISYVDSEILNISNYRNWYGFGGLESDLCGNFYTTDNAWYGVSLSSGTGGATTSYVCHPCVYGLRTNNGGVGTGYGFTTGASAFLLSGGESTDIIFSKVTRSGKNSSNMILGFSDSASTTIPSDGVYFNITNVSLYAKVRSNNAEISSGVYTITEDVWYRARISIVNSSQAVFELYNSTDSNCNGNTDLVFTSVLNGTLPTGTGRQLGHGVFAWRTLNGTQDFIAYVDYVNIRINRTLVR